MKRIVVLLLCFALCAVFVSCGKTDNEKKQFTAYSMDCFDTVTTVVGYEKTKEEFDKVAEEIFSLLDEYHKLYDIYNTYEGMENLCAVNELVDGAHRTVKVDRRIADLLVYAKQMYAFTEGKVNVAMGSVLSLWHDCRTGATEDNANAALPAMEQLERAAEHTDINNVIVDEENCTVTLADKDMTLDVGAVAKGYAVQKISEKMREKGISGYVLNVGGNVCAIGEKPDGKAWIAGIENPNGEEYLEYVELRDRSLVTSGSYQRFYYVDGKKYHHIIHPDTLMPAGNFLSVSVICNNSALADVLSTALFCMEREEGMTFVEACDSVECMWVTDDGVKYASSGWEKYVKE